MTPSDDDSTTIWPWRRASESRRRPLISPFRPEGDPSLLVVDPDPVRRVALVRALQRKGWTVLHAADGRDGESVARESSCDVGVLVATIEAGIISGFELARRVRRLHSDVRVLLLCHRQVDDEQRLRALESGYEAIARPDDVEELTRRIAATASDRGSSLSSCRERPSRSACFWCGSLHVATRPLSVCTNCAARLNESP